MSLTTPAAKAGRARLVNLGVVFEHRAQCRGGFTAPPAPRAGMMSQRIRAEVSPGMVAGMLLPVCSRM